MIDANSPMSDIVAGLKRADDAACHAFCQRQNPSLLDALDNGASRLGAIAFELECRQPATLIDWKFPEVFEPVEALPDALNAACEGREDRVYDLLADAPFADLAATASACSHIQSAVAQIRRYGPQMTDPQQSLWSE